MKTKPCIAIFGYNNTRIYDVYKIKNLIQEEYGAELLLIKEGITQEDLNVTPYCLDHKPEDPQISQSLQNYLSDHQLILKACLPFSDKGVIGAAHASRELNLFGDDAPSSFAMLDKNLFRELENKISINSEFYKKPFFHKIFNADEARACFSKNGAFFIKPTSEGNSRGCMKIETLQDLENWILNYGQNSKNGVICEEILSDSNEYSFDGVAGQYWITQKFTTTGAYRAEYQHIIPAPLSPQKHNQIHSLLKPLLSDLGSNGGAFHHEFFILDDERVASVEPNRRPAGMWLWDLASWSFPGFNLWLAWLQKCVHGQTFQAPIKTDGFSGVRGVIFKIHEVKKHRDQQYEQIKSINIEQIETQLKELNKNNLYKFSMLKKVGDTVTSLPKDNSDFLAFIAIKNENYEELLINLDAAEQIILNGIEV
jgi:hypothetical protein